MKQYRIRPVILSKAWADKGAMTYLIYHGEQIVRPYIFWIIEGAGQKIIVDTAIHAEQYRGYHPGFQNYQIEHLLTFEEGLSKALLQPDDVDIIIQTHLHFDHCYNTSQCKNARVVVQESELEFAKDPHPIFANMYSEFLLKDLKFEPIRGRREILPGIEVIPVPGHTPGCQAVSVETKVGRAVIAGFCCIKENFFPGEEIQERISPFAGYPIIVPGIHFDTVQAYESVLKIKELADIVLPLHEPEIMNIESIP